MRTVRNSCLIIGGPLRPKQMRLACSVCSKPFLRTTNTQRFCSAFCKRRHHREQAKSKNAAPLDIAPASVGAIGELQVSADLLAKGYSVYRSVSPSAPADLVALKNGECVLVEVTTGFRNGNGALGYKRHDHCAHIFDVVAVVERDGKITYIPELPNSASSSPDLAHQITLASA